MVAVRKLVGAVTSTAAAGTSIALCGWAAAAVFIVAVVAVVFVIWWVLSDTDRSKRLTDILAAIWNSRR